MGNYQGAIEDFDRSTKLEPNDAYSAKGLGYARSALGDKQGAIDDYTHSIKLKPNDAITYESRGFTRFELGDKQGAIDDYDRAAEIYLKQGKVQEHLQVVDRSYKLRND